MQTYMVESIVSLLKESKVPTVEQKENCEGKTQTPAVDNITIEERQLLGRYGVWLLVGRCTPDEKTPDEILGRLLAMLFHWFHMTAYSYDGKVSISNTEKKSRKNCRPRRKRLRKAKNRQRMRMVKRHKQIALQTFYFVPPATSTRICQSWGTLVQPRRTYPKQN